MKSALKSIAFCGVVILVGAVIVTGIVFRRLDALLLKIFTGETK
jgi:hypothetical protein